MRFRLTTLLWFFALCASAMGTFGAWGGIAALAGVWFTWNLFRMLSRSTGHSILVVSTTIAILLLLLLPAVQIGRTPSRSGTSLNKLKQLVLCMHDYEAAYGVFPPPYTTDSYGNRLHSWRTLMLPYLWEQGLYNSVLLHKPWDSPANTRLFNASSAMDCMTSPRLPAGRGSSLATHYLAVVDDRAVLRPSGGVRLKDITDGASQTIVLIEVLSNERKWYEPHDLTLQEAVDLLTGDAVEESVWVDRGFFASAVYDYNARWRRLVALADGSTRAIGIVPDRSTALAMLTGNGGEPIDINQIDFEDRTHQPSSHVIHWGRIWGLGLFVLLSFAPIFRSKASPDTPTLEAEQPPE